MPLRISRRLRSLMATCRRQSRSANTLPVWNKRSCCRICGPPVGAVRACARSGIARDRLRNNSLNDNRRGNLRLDLHGLLDLRCSLFRKGLVIAEKAARNPAFALDKVVFNTRPLAFMCQNHHAFAHIEPVEDVGFCVGRLSQGDAVSSNKLELSALTVLRRSHGCGAHCWCRRWQRLLTT